MSEILDQPWTIHSDGPAPDKAEFVASDFVQVPVEPYFAFSEGALSHSGSREIPEELPAYQRAFEEHVAYVRDNGDPLEPTRRFYDIGRGVGRNLLHGGVLGSTGAFAGTETWSVTGVAAVVAGAGMYLADRHHRKKVEPALEYHIDHNAIDAVGESYDLIRIKDKQTGEHEVVLQWNGTNEHFERDETGELRDKIRPADESMQRIAELAKAQGIKAILIDHQKLEYTSFKPENHATGQVSIPGWIKTHKGLQPEFLQYGKVKERTAHVFTPDQLSRMAAEPQYSNKRIETVEGIVNILRARDPLHRIVRTFDEQAGKPADRLQEIRVAAKQALEPKIQDIGSKFARDQDGLPTRERVLLQGHLHSDMAILQGTGKYNGQEFDRTAILRAFSLTSEQLADILQNPADYPDRKVVLAAECAAYLQTQPVESFRQVASHATKIINYDAPTSALINASLRNKGGSVNSWLLKTKESDRSALNTQRPYRLRRKISALAFAASGMAAVGIGIGAQETDVPYLSDGARNVASAAEAMHGGIYSTGQGMVDWATSFGDEDKSGSDSINKPASNGFGSSIGNAQTDQETLDREDWQVDAHGGMSATGYWAANTAQALNLREYTWNEYFSTDQANIIGRGGLPTALADASEYLEVGRAIRGDEGQDIRSADGTEYTYFTIPVLEGTRPAAANVAGEPIELVQMADGNYAVGVSRSEDVRQFTYWLVPDEHAPTARNIDGFEVYDAGLESYGPDMYNRPQRLSPEEQATIRQAWEAELGREYADDHERMLAEIAYIKQNFTYSRTPIESDFSERMEAGEVPLNEFVQYVIDDREAVCNTAATAIAADNAEEVTPVTGYFNGNDENEDLTVRESHMWLADTYGNYYDPSPGFGEDRDQEQPTTDYKTPGKIALAGMALLGTAYGARRLRPAVSGKLDAMRTVRATGQAASDLDLITAEDLYFAKQVTDQSDYGPRIDTARAMQMPEGMTREQAMEMATQPHLHDENLARSLKKAIKAATAEDKQALRRAEKILATVRNAGLARSYDTPVHVAQPADLTGLL